MNSLYKRSILKIMDLSSKELKIILKLASLLKKEKKNCNEISRILGKKILLLFQEPSTRTRCCCEIALFDQKVNFSYIDFSQLHMNYKESIIDTAKFLGSLYDGIFYRGNNHNDLNIFSENSGVPVWNALTDKFHPTQLLGDLLTIKEIFPKLSFSKIKLIYIGDTNNNISNTLLEVSALTGLNLYLVGPKKYWPDLYKIQKYSNLSKKKGGNIFLLDNYKKCIKKADFIYTDVWFSMCEDLNFLREKIFYLKSYQVNMKMLKDTCNKNIKFLHCLPAMHNLNTYLSRKISKEFCFTNGIEVTNDVFQSQYSIVFKQAENRIHVIKAIMILTLLKSFSKIFLI